MTITGDHLGRDVLPPKAQPVEHGGLELGAVGRVRPDRTRERPHRHALGGSLQPDQVSVRLEGEAREFHAERRWLGMHSVRAADADRVLAGAREPAA